MSHSHAAKFQDASVAIQFILAGRARLTIVSARTGARFTYRVVQPTETSPHFVKVLTGSDNETAYTFLGTIFEGKTYRHSSRKSPISPEAPSALAWGWLWEMLMNGKLPASCEVWHEGRCGKCGRALTVPESIESGIGPVCAEGREAA